MGARNLVAAAALACGGRLAAVLPRRMPAPLDAVAVD
jgi:hypothetical protein